MFATCDEIIAAISHFPVKSVVVLQGGGNTSLVLPILRLCMKKRIPIVVQIGYSAGVWFALSEYVQIAPNVILELHGMGDHTLSFRESLHLVRNAFGAFDAGVREGIFKESRAKWLKQAFQKHLLGKKDSFWENFHPVSLWFDVSDVLTK